MGNTNLSDQVSIHIDPILSEKEQMYLLGRSSMFGSRKHLNIFINKMVLFIENIKTPKRYTYLEFFILLKLNDKPFLTRKQKGTINSYAKSYNSHINGKNCNEKGALKSAIESSIVIALEDPKTIKVLNRVQLVEVPKIESSEVAPSSETELTMSNILSKRLQLCRSAESRNLEFNLTDKDVKEILERKTCYYTGARFSDNPNYKRTVDRIDNSKGYITGNVVACTNGINQLKNEILENDKNDRFILTIKQLRKMVSRLDCLT